MNIDPKISAILNIVIAVLGVVAASTAYFTGVFGEQTGQAIVGTAGFALALLGAVNGTLHGLNATDNSKLLAVEAMPGIKEIVPVTGATGAVAAAVADPDRPKVIDANPAPPSGVGKPATP